MFLSLVLDRNLECSDKFWDSHISTQPENTLLGEDKLLFLNMLNIYISREREYLRVNKNQLLAWLFYKDEEQMHRHSVGGVHTYS